MFKWPSTEVTMWTVVVINSDGRFQSYCRGLFRTRREAKDFATSNNLHDAKILKLTY